MTMKKSHYQSEFVDKDCCNTSWNKFIKIRPRHVSWAVLRLQHAASLNKWLNGLMLPINEHRVNLNFANNILDNAYLKTLEIVGIKIWHFLQGKTWSRIFQEVLKDLFFKISNILNGINEQSMLYGDLSNINVFNIPLLAT